MQTIITLILGGFAFMSALGATLAVIHRWFWKPALDALDRRVDAHIDIDMAPVLEKLEDIEADVADIRHEVNTNNGRSLKDVALQTRTEVAVLTGRFEDHLTAHKEQ